MHLLLGREGIGVKYIDIGVNLFSRQFAGREEQIVKRAAEAGAGMIITGSSLYSSKQAAEFCDGIYGNGSAGSGGIFPVLPACSVYATAGVHPHDARTCDERTIDELRKLAREHSGVIAVGECGLDYDRMFSPAEVQRYWFERQVELAEELDLPLFLHERAASEDFSSILAGHPEVCRRAVVHCFTGTRAEAERYLEMGCMIGITGWICDERRNGDLLEALKSIPVERLMAETDAPYLKPRGIKGLKGPNVPENIVHVIARIAAEKGMDEAELAEIILRNTKSFFGI